ncbi:MAG: beta strand repeat-containing protein, partial [Fusobacteriaceae bacterium]
MREITEKRLKSCLKNRVSLNMETIVKFLITGTVAFSLTACGGGGSSSGGDTNVGGGNNDNNNGGGTTEKDVIISSSSNSKADGSTLVFGKNNNIKISKDVVLTVSHNNSIGAHITNSSRMEAKLTNEGKIEVSGDKSIGILADNNAIAINEGVITGKSNVVSGFFDKEQEGQYGRKETYTTKKKYDWIEGMRSESGAVATNNSIITINGSGAGMASDSANLENNGTIEVKSGDQEYSIHYMEYGGGTPLTVYTEIGDSKEYVVGMKGENNSQILNDKNGKIVLIGEGHGMLAVKDSEAINKGSIELTAEKVVFEKLKEGQTSEFETIEGWTKVVGMVAAENSTIINEGTIEINTPGIGMVAEGSSTAINNKNILMASNQGNIVGMQITEKSSGINNGEIVVKGSINEDINAYSDVSVKGIDAYGTRIYSEDKSSYEAVKVDVLNTGLIHVIGNKGVGISVKDGDLTNSGEIVLEGKYTTALKISGEGKLINTSNLSASRIGISAKQDYYEYIKNLTVENEGNILVSSNGEIIKNSDGDYSSLNAAVGIESNGADVYNSGNINAKGDGAETASGISYQGASAAKGIFASNVKKVENHGTITVEGNSTNTYNSYGATGLEVLALGMEEEKKAETVNNGIINVTGNGGVGISLLNSDLINIGEIEVSGLAANGIKNNDVRTSDYFILNKIENEGNIIIIGDEGIGINLKQSNLINTGKIEVSGLGAIGIKNMNEISYNDSSMKKIENEGNIIVTGDAKIEKQTGLSYYNIYNAAIGIESSKINVYNSGDITAKGDGAYLEYETNLGQASYVTASAAKGIVALDAEKVENYGNITVEGNHPNSNYKNSSVGLEVSGKSYYDSELSQTVYAKTINGGAISITGDRGVGISLSNSNLINTGKILVSGLSGIGINSNYSISNTIENENSITILSSGGNSVGIKGSQLSSVFNSAEILIDSIAESATGISGSKVQNDGEIKITGNVTQGAIGISSYSDLVTNKGTISIIGDKGIGVDLNNSDLVNMGEIVVSGLSAVGVKNNDNSGNDSLQIKIENEGNVTVIGDAKIEKQTDSNDYNRYEAAIGIKSHGAAVYNSGDIIVKGDGAYLEYETNFGTLSETVLAAIGIVALNTENYGNITVEGNGTSSEYGAIGIYGSNIKNSGNVNVIGNYSVGLKTNSGELINNSKITVEGEYSKGVYSYLFSTATNNGIINIDGNGSYGMYASSNSTIVNGLEGVINVGASAAGGMYADFGSTAINYGTINIHKDNLGGESIAMLGYGTLINTGIITTDTDLTVNTTNGGSYVIGTNESGSYGKISGKNISIDGEVVVSSNITKNGFKDEYTMQNVVDAEELKLGEEFKFVSNSLLYDAEAVTDRWGNLDATLNRNDKVLSNFTTGYSTYTANIFGKYQNEDSFKALSSEAKEVIKSIDTSSVESIEKSLDNLTPTIYSNLGRQMLDTSETFKAQDAIAIDSLGENSYNFTFLGEYRDVDSRGNIEGYESELSGFVGAMSFGDGTFGTLGYG